MVDKLDGYFIMFWVIFNVIVVKVYYGKVVGIKVV